MNESFCRQTRRRRSIRGFTLIELMIVVAIIAILTAIAYPAYTHYVIRTRRTAATACMSQYANYMERFYTTNMAYDKDPTGAAPAPTLDCTGVQQTGSSYQYALNPLTPTTYTITATPIATGPQAADTQCGQLTLNQAGQRTPAVAGCW